MPEHTRELPITGKPLSHLSSGQWPDGRLKTKAPPETRLAQAITRRLEKAIRGQTQADAAEAAAVAPATLHKLRRGMSWGVVSTIARLERRLGIRLWGDEHIHPAPRDHLDSGAWPYGRLKKDAPDEARLLKAIVTRLLEPGGRRALPLLAKAAGVSQLTLQELCDGRYWGDLITIARLEGYLRYPLWGYEHRRERSPKDYLDFGNWPEGRLVGDAPPAARLAQGIVIRLHIACRKTPPEVVAREADLRQSVVQALLDGTTWVDFATIASLEIATKELLWGHEHRQQVRNRTFKEELRGR